MEDALSVNAIKRRLDKGQKHWAVTGRLA